MIVVVGVGAVVSVVSVVIVGVVVLFVGVAMVVVDVVRCRCKWVCSAACAGCYVL